MFSIEHYDALCVQVHVRLIFDLIADVPTVDSTGMLRSECCSPAVEGASFRLLLCGLCGQLMFVGNTVVGNVIHIR